MSIIGLTLSLVVDSVADSLKDLLPDNSLVSLIGEQMIWGAS